MGTGDGGLPSGVVTFLFTDVEGSTRLWDLHPELMGGALARHDALIEAAVTAAGGTLLKSRGEGDSTFSVFDRPTQAVAAALAARRDLEAEPWPEGCPIDVRFAIHAGEVSERDGDYYGTAVNRAARVRGLAVGGQILVSEAVAAVVADHLPPGAALVDLGKQELRGLRRAEGVSALVDGAKPGREAIGGACPYPGLLAFQPEDHDVYFGREQLIASLLPRLTERRVLVVVGASGSGKSSLVRAGIVPALSRGEVPGQGPWTVRILTPGADPVGALQRALPDDADEPTVVVVDQMEELFTACRDAAARARFVDDLLDRVASADGRLAVLGALRADFYGHCASVPRLAGALDEGTALLGPMDELEVRRAIEAPAEVVGLGLEPGLVDLMLRDLAHEPGALPLLSHALLETWQRRRGRTLTIEGYEASGGVRGAIARTAETLWNEQLLERQRPSARRIFLRLTELGEGTEDTRRRVRREELTGGDGGDDLDEIVRVLADARLVTVDEGTVEVAHEALIREWPRLRGWLDDDRERLRAHRHLTHAAEDWDALGRDPSELYRGPRLVTARELLGHPVDGDARGVTLNVLEDDFLRASIEAEETERQEQEAQAEARERANRRLRVLLVAAVVMLVLAVGAGALALRQRDRANEQAERAQAASVAAEVDRIVAEVPQLLDRDRGLAALLAAEAVRLRPTPAARGALLSTLTSEPRLRFTLNGGREGYQRAAPFPDGRRMAAGGLDGVDVWDIDAHHLLGTVAVEDSSAFAVSPDSSLLAVGSADGTVTFWDADELEPAGASLTFAERVTGLSFSPDGRTLGVSIGMIEGTAAATPETSPQLVDVATRRLTGTRLGGHLTTVNAIAFSPDGRRIATGGNDGRIVLHDAGTGRTLGSPIQMFAGVFGLAFSPDSRLIAGGTFQAGPQGQIAAVFDVATHRQVDEGLVGTEGVTTLQFTVDGSQLLVSSGSVRAWDTSTWTPIGEPIETQHGPAHVVSLPDHPLLVSGNDGTITAWDVDGVPLVARLIPGAPNGGGIFSPDGETLVTVDNADRALLFRADDLDRLASISVGDPGPRASLDGATPVAFSPSGDTLAVGDRHGRVRLFDTDTLRAAGPPIAVGSFPIVQLTFSPDGQLLAATNNLAPGNGAHVVDVATGAVRELEPPVPFALASTFTPDGSQLVVTTAAGAAYRYTVANGELGGGQPIDAVEGTAATAAFSPDGSSLAVGTLNGSLELLDAETFEPVGAPITVSPTYLASIAFNGDGSLAVLQDLDTSVRLVDVHEGAPLGEAIRGSGEGFGYASFAPNGSVVLTPGPGGSLLLDLDADRWREAACELAGRQLTEAEWDQYLPSAGNYDPSLLTGFERRVSVAGCAS